MQALHCGWWGALGGAVIELYDNVATMRATRLWPWLDPETAGQKLGFWRRSNDIAIWLMATIFRIAAGGGAAAILHDQISGDMVAAGIGVAGPLALERIAAAAPLGKKQADSRSTGVRAKAKKAPTKKTPPKRAIAPKIVAPSADDAAGGLADA